LFLLQPTIAGLARQELIAAGATTDPSGLPVIPGQERQNPGGGGGGGGATPTPTASGGGGGGTPTPTASSSGGSGSSESPGTSTSPGVTEPPGVGPAGQRDGRLQGSTDEQPVDQGITLYITDLIFNNPSDTLTGQLIIGRRDPTQDPSDSPLLILQLQNFRDIDYHFVTPLLVPGGQSLFLNCPTGCDGASVLWSGYQR
jgi:hypothetical protein